MAFTNNFRIERVYFERLKTLIEVLKSYKDNVAEEPARTMIENAIDVDGAVLLLYRNLGEAWAELADLIQKTQKLLQDLDDKTEAYHDELNERIDEVNNYLMALIRALEARVDAIEADLRQMGRLFTYDLNRVNDEYSLSESGTPVTFESTTQLFSHTRPHLVTVRGNVDGETMYFFPREYDSDTTDGHYEWYTFGFAGNEIQEITVRLLSNDSVSVSIKTTDFAAILQRISDLETRMTTAEGDIDTLEQTAENHNDRITDLEECCDDMTENVIPGLQSAIAGKQDALTPGTGIDITNNEISVDTDVVQEKLVAGSGISIDPVTKEITNTAQGVNYTAGRNIDLSNNEIKVKVPYLGIKRLTGSYTNLRINRDEFTIVSPNIAIGKKDFTVLPLDGESFVKAISINDGSFNFFTAAATDGDFVKYTDIIEVLGAFDYEDTTQTSGDIFVYIRTFVYDSVNGRFIKTGEDFTKNYDLTSAKPVPTVTLTLSRTIETKGLDLTTVPVANVFQRNSLRYRRA